MPVGDTGKWRVNAPFALPTTEDVWEGVEFETEVGTAASIFTQNGNYIDIQINETGWYLANYRVRTPGESTNRMIGRVRALWNSAVIEGSQGTGWMRSGANNEILADARCMFEVTSTGQNFRVEYMTRGEDSTPTDDATADSEISLIRLPDETDVAYAIYTSTDTSAYSTTSWVASTWDIDEETDTGVIARQDTDTIRLKKIARYLVCYNVTFQNTNRSQRLGRMTLASTEIPHSNSHCYLRDTDTDFNTISAIFIVDNTIINQDIELEIQRGNSNITTGTRVSGESRLCIMELPEAAEVVIGYDATGAQETTATGYLNACRTTPTIDSDSFTRLDNTTIEVVEAGDYLFMVNGRINRATSTGTRSQHGLRWTKNDVDQQDISMDYIRGLQSSNYTYDAAFNGSFMANLAANDDVEFEFFRAGDAGLGQTVGGSLGMCALNIATLGQRQIFITHQ